MGDRLPLTLALSPRAGRGDTPSRARAVAGERRYQKNVIHLYEVQYNPRNRGELKARWIPAFAGTTLRRFDGCRLAVLRIRKGDENQNHA